jgi:hypothetical protein
MSRHVVATRWAEGVTPEAKHAFRDALDGNFDFVAVHDVAAFASART